MIFPDSFENEWRIKASNQSMKPTTNVRNKLSMFATTPPVTYRLSGSPRFSPSGDCVFAPRIRRIVLFNVCFISVSLDRFTCVQYVFLAA